MRANVRVFEAAEYRYATRKTGSHDDHVAVFSVAELQPKLRLFASGFINFRKIDKY